MTQRAGAATTEGTGWDVLSLLRPRQGRGQSGTWWARELRGGRWCSHGGGTGHVCSVLRPWLVHSKGGDAGGVGREGRIDPGGLGPAACCPSCASCLRTEDEGASGVGCVGCVNWGDWGPLSLLHPSLAHRRGGHGIGGARDERGPKGRRHISARPGQREGGGQWGRLRRWWGQTNPFAPLRREGAHRRGGGRGKGSRQGKTN